MMGDLQLTTALASIAAVVLLSVLLFSFLPAYRLDSFRQRMFGVRDSLWDYAASGKIAFDDPAYLLLRKLTNGFIRYGHQLTFFRVMMTTLHWRFIDQTPVYSWRKKWDVAIAQVKDPEVRQTLESFHTVTMWVAGKHLISGSPILTAILFGSFAMKLAESGWTSLRQMIKSSGVQSLEWTVDEALVEESAARVGSGPRLVYH
jgi:hypothetical protein